MSHLLSSIQLDYYFFSEISLEIVEDRQKLQFDFDPSFSINTENEMIMIELEFEVYEENTKINGVFVGFFKYDTTLDENELSPLIYRNGISILLPYLRAGISQISSVSNVSVIVIPTINVQEYMAIKMNKYEE